MGQLGKLPDAETTWRAVAMGIDGLGAVEHGPFGHPHQRRLGLRVAASCWALLTREAHSSYAVAVELSPTGVVLELVGPEHGAAFRPEHRFRLDLFLPTAPSPVRTIVRPVRAVGEGEAFELVEIAATDRLTLAEYLRSADEEAPSAPCARAHATEILMNAPQVPANPLPRYGIREDEMTRPGVVLFDWNGDDEATARVSPFTLDDLGPGDDDEEDENEEEDDELEVSLFGRRFHGIGRRPGAVALGLVLGLSVGIGFCALFASGETQTGAQSAELSLR